MKALKTIAILVFTSLVFATCGNPAGNGGNGGNGGELSGDIYILSLPWGIVGFELTAIYSGTEPVNYHWKLDGTDVGINSDRYTPDTVGSYTVMVSAPGYNRKTSMNDVYISLPDVIIDLGANTVTGDPIITSGSPNINITTTSGYITHVLITGNTGGISRSITIQGGALIYIADNTTITGTGDALIVPNGAIIRGGGQNINITGKNGGVGGHGISSNGGHFDFFGTIGNITGGNGSGTNGHGGCGIFTNGMVNIVGTIGTVTGGNGGNGSSGKSPWSNGGDGGDGGHGIFSSHVTISGAAFSIAGGSGGKGGIKGQPFGSSGSNGRGGNGINAGVGTVRIDGTVSSIKGIGVPAIVASTIIGWP